MLFLASYAPNGRYVMPTDHMRCLVAWTGDLGALEAVRKLLRAPNDSYDVRGPNCEYRKGTGAQQRGLRCNYRYTRHSSTPCRYISLACTYVL